MWILHEPFLKVCGWNCDKDWDLSVIFNMAYVRLYYVTYVYVLFICLVDWQLAINTALFVHVCIHLLYDDDDYISRSLK